MRCRISLRRIYFLYYGVQRSWIIDNDKLRLRDIHQYPSSDPLARAVINNNHRDLKKKKYNVIIIIILYVVHIILLHVLPSAAPVAQPTRLLGVCISCRRCGCRERLFTHFRSCVARSRRRKEGELRSPVSRACNIFVLLLQTHTYTHILNIQ